MDFLRRQPNDSLSFRVFDLYLAMNDSSPVTIAKKRFTLPEAVAMLPLVRSIATDISGVFRHVTSRRLELHRLLRRGNRGAGRVFDDEMAESRADLQEEYGQIGKYCEELESLGVLVRKQEDCRLEFPTLIDGREAFFSWELGEPTIAYFRLASDANSVRKPLHLDLN